MSVYLKKMMDVINVSGQPSSMRVLQITDSHLGGSSDETLIGLNTEQSLRDVLSMIKEQEEPFDLIVSTGDISNDGTVASYDRFISLVNEYLPGTPLAWLEGNHDDPEKMQAVNVDKPLERYFEMGQWQFILLNSRIPRSEGGNLAQDELTRLEAILEKNPTKPTMIFLHHQIVPVGCDWVDKYVVKSADTFFEIIDKYTNVKSISWGHVHQSFERKRGSVSLYASPSTCVQFLPNSKTFAVDKAMPGYRIFDLKVDGTFSTHVNRVDERYYAIDFASSGY